MENQKETLYILNTKIVSESEYDECSFSIVV